MRSELLRALSRERFERLAALTPDERVRLALRLGEEGVRSYMSIHRVDRATAIARIKATHRLGRRASKCDAAP